MTRYLTTTEGIESGEINTPVFICHRANQVSAHMLLILIRPHGPPRRRWKALPHALGLALCGLAVLVSGCAQTPLPAMSTPLPDLKRQAIDGLLTPAQKQKEIDALAAKKAEEQAAAVKQIEKSR